MKISIYKDYVDAGYDIHDKARIEIKPGFTVLVGCNGAGKTTLMHQIKDFARKKDYPCQYFNNLVDGESHARSKAAFLNDWTFVATSISSSEGENIMLNLGRVSASVGKMVRSNVEDKLPVFILMDAVDSGLSIDNIVEFKKYFIDVVLEDCKQKGIEVYIIASANGYELCRGENCYDVAQCKYVTFKDYEEYPYFILKSRKQKEEKLKPDMEAQRKHIDKIEENNNSRKEEKKSENFREKEEDFVDAITKFMQPSQDGSYVIATWKDDDTEEGD